MPFKSVNRLPINYESINKHLSYSTTISLRATWPHPLWCGVGQTDIAAWSTIIQIETAQITHSVITHKSLTLLTNTQLCLKCCFEEKLQATFTWKRFWLKTLTFLYRCTFCSHENSENTREKIFSLKMLTEVETFESATDQMQTKCSVNVENVFEKTTCRRGLGKQWLNRSWWWERS